MYEDDKPRASARFQLGATAEATASSAEATAEESDEKWRRACPHNKLQFQCKRCRGLPDKTGDPVVIDSDEEDAVVIDSDAEEGLARGSGAAGGAAGPDATAEMQQRERKRQRRIEEQLKIPLTSIITSD